MSPKLMKSCVVRVLGPAVAKVMGAARVAALDRIVREVRRAPLGGHGGITVDPELAHEARDHPEESDVFEVAGAHQIVKAVGAVGRKRAGNFNDDLAFGGIELRLEGFGRLLRELARIGKIGGCGGRFGVRLGLLGNGQGESQTQGQQANQQ